METSRDSCLEGDGGSQHTDSSDWSEARSPGRWCLRQSFRGRCLFKATKSIAIRTKKLMGEIEKADPQKSEISEAKSSPPLVDTLAFRHLEPKFLTFDDRAIESLIKLANRVRTEIEASAKNAITLMTFLIRKDNETIATYRWEEFLRVYEQANKIHSVEIHVKDYATPQQSNRSISIKLQTATSPELNEAVNVISVVGEDPTWVDGIYSAFQNAVGRLKNRHFFWYRTSVLAIAQILAVLTFTIYSVFLGQKMARFIPINNPEVYTFIVFLLLFSNIWSYASNVLLGFIQKRNPVVELINKPPSTLGLTIFWSIVTGVIGSAIWFVIQLLVTR